MIFSRPQVTLCVFKVTGETNTDDLSPAPDAWSRPDIPLHALAMLKLGVFNSMDQVVGREKSSRRNVRKVRLYGGFHSHGTPKWIINP